MIKSIEIWLPVKGYEGYEVSNQGRVRNAQGKILKPRLNSCWYYRIGLWKKGKQKWVFVHRIVAEAFIPNPLNLPEVNHKDENKENNFVWVNDDKTIDFEKSNLEWVSHIQNMRHGTRFQRMLEKEPKKTVNQYSLDGVLIATYSSIHEAARQTGVDYRNISMCCRGKRKTAGGFIWLYA